MFGCSFYPHNWDFAEVRGYASWYNGPEAIQCSSLHRGMFLIQWYLDIKNSLLPGVVAHEKEND